MYEVKYWDLLDDSWDINNPLINDEIYDFEIFNRTWRSKHFFVILWACRQGDIEGYYDHSAGKAVGMPFSWHHPVTNYDCFIGFKGASMPLTQYSSNNTNVPYRDFVMYFSYYVIHQNKTIIEALELASQALFGCSYFSTELHKGFTAYWEYPPEWGNLPSSGSGKMVNLRKL